MRKRLGLPPLNRPAESSGGVRLDDHEKKELLKPSKSSGGSVQRSTPCSGEARTGSVALSFMPPATMATAPRGEAPRQRHRKIAWRAVVVRPMASLVRGSPHVQPQEQRTRPMRHAAMTQARAPVARPMVTPRARELRSAHRTGSTATATATTAITTTGVTSMKSTRKRGGIRSTRSASVNATRAQAAAVVRAATARLQSGGGGMTAMTTKRSSSSVWKAWCLQETPSFRCIPMRCGSCSYMAISHLIFVAS